MALNAETAIVQALIAHCTGITLSQDQLRHCAGRSAEGGAFDAKPHKVVLQRINPLLNDLLITYVMRKA